MVRKVGLEPTRCLNRWLLRPVCLPVSSLPHITFGGLGRNRTDTPVKETDFESVVATSYTTSPQREMLVVSAQPAKRIGAADRN